MINMKYNNLVLSSAYYFSLVTVQYDVSDCRTMTLHHLKMIGIKNISMVL